MNKPGFWCLSLQSAVTSKDHPGGSHKQPRAISTEGVYSFISHWEHPMELLPNTVLRLGQSWGVSQSGRKGKSLLVCDGSVWTLWPERQMTIPHYKQGHTPKQDHSSCRHRSASRVPIFFRIPLHAFKAMRVSNAESRLGPAPNEIITNVATNTERCRTRPVAHTYIMCPEILARP